MPVLAPCLLRLLFRDGEVAVLQQFEPVVVGLLCLAREVAVFWPVGGFVNGRGVHRAILVEDRTAAEARELEWCSGQGL